MDEPEHIIPLEEGWARVYDIGVRPYLDRIEAGVDSKEFELCKVKSSTFIEVYDTVFKMCIQREPQNWSQQLYDRYVECIDTHLIEHYVPALRSALKESETAFLQEWTQRWQKIMRVIRGLEKMFMYLNRFYVANNEHIVALSKQGYMTYQQRVFNTFQGNVMTCVLQAVDRERKEQVQDRDLLQKAVRVFVDLGFEVDEEQQLYKTGLEKALLKQTSEHYREKAKDWMESETCPGYLCKVEESIERERGRMETYIEHSSTEPMLLVCRTVLLAEHQMPLLEKPTGLIAMLNQTQMDDLARLFRLFNHVDEGKQPIAEMLRDHVTELGFSLVDASKKKAQTKQAAAKGDEDEHELIKGIIALHVKYQSIVHSCFKKHQIFEKSMKEGFEEFINKEYHTSNLLARFVNAVLVKGSKLQIQDLEQTLEHIVVLYGYIRQKDVFEEKYHSFLASRLLTNKSASQQAEKSMIAKLKSESGYQWTRKLETMFKDVQISNELGHEFRSSTMGQALEEELRVIVCTSGSWPSSSVPIINTPRQLKPLCDRFKNFFVQKHSGRKLTWAMQQGEAEILVHFNESTSRLLVCTTYMATILLCFEDPAKKVLTYQQIEEMTKIPKRDLEANILSLAHPKKARILLKSPSVKELLPTDKFTINSKYSNKAYRVQVRLLRLSGSTDDDAVSKQIKIQRRHQIDAAIVRVMKTRQMLPHQQLVAEVMKQLTRFEPDPADIKKRIEALIEQEYLARDENDRRVYKYLA